MISQENRKEYKRCISAYHKDLRTSNKFKNMFGNCFGEGIARYPGVVGHSRERPSHGLRKLGNDCATGVAFTRDPSAGKNEFYGEFLVNAQGEDVVAGIRTPQELTIMARQSHGSDLPSLEEVMPNIFRELLSVRSQL